MQTFLPFADFDRSARVLDDRRLGKQRVEALQVLRALHLDGYGWANHPAVTMWRGHTRALVAYGLAVVDEWLSRGHSDTTRANIAEFSHPDPVATQPGLAARDLLPPWLGWEPFHRSHRSALLRKDPQHYGACFGDTPDDLPYAWPDPPAPPPEPGQRSAWVVRSCGDDDHIAVAVRGDADPYAATGRGAARLTKRQRQIDRFVNQMQPGDLVGVPHVGELRLVTVTGGHVIDGGHHVRRVSPCGWVPRRDLRFPAALQDPQEVFVLYDEPALECPTGLRVDAGNA